MIPVVDLLVGGMASGLVYVLLAAGLILVLSVSRVFLIAYGQLYMVGAYTAYAAVSWWKLPFVVALPLAMLVVAAVGMLCYAAVFRFAERAQRQFLATIVAAAGLMIILNHAVLTIFGASPRTVPTVIRGSVNLLGTTLPNEKLAIIGASVVVTLALFLVYRRTRLGRAMRAVSVSPDVAALHGIVVSRIHLVTMGVSGALAGFAGAMLAPVYGVTTEMGNEVFLTIMLVAMLGGMDSLVGAVLGGLVVGVTSALGQYLLPSYSQIILYAVIGIIILVRPGGLVGRTSSVEV